MLQIPSGLQRVVFLLAPKRFLIVALDQYLLSLTSIATSFLSFNSLDEMNLADFVIIWAGIWGLVAILSETLVNPLRVKSNAHLQKNPDHLPITEICSFLFHSGISLLMLGSIFFKFKVVSLVCLSLSLALLYTCYTINRNVNIDKKSHTINVRRSGSVLAMVIFPVGFYSHAYSLTLFVVLFIYSLSLILVQLGNSRNITTYLVGISHALGILIQNLKFGVSTILRIFLFSISILYILRLIYPTEITIQYGLVMSLSNPGVILASLISQSEFKKLMESKDNEFQLLNFLQYYKKVFYLSLIGCIITALLCVTLSAVSYQYNVNIEEMGFLRIVSFSFFTILFIALSGLISSLIQIYQLRDIQVLAVMFAGALSMALLFVLPPLTAVFTPYIFYILAIAGLQSGKGFIGAKKNLRITKSEH